MAREAKRRHQEAAWLGAIFLAPYTPKDGDPVTPAQLLGHKPRKSTTKRHFTSPAEAAQAFFDANKAKERASGK